MIKDSQAFTAQFMQSDLITAINRYFPNAVWEHSTTTDIRNREYLTFKARFNDFSIVVAEQVTDSNRGELEVSNYLGKIIYRTDKLLYATEKSENIDFVMTSVKNWLYNLRTDINNICNDIDTSILI